nr:MAG TPA: hypothetical protein [Crassvirales sp.]
MLILATTVVVPILSITYPPHSFQPFFVFQQEKYYCIIS